ncbi:alpha/beta hydrolase [Streptomyces coelicoflavus]|uniref:alpha/beta hydrolase n=1 Tax=Streptomyces coelicoflavus TaxID=285562 RepID=UPI0036A9B735
MKLSETVPGVALNALSRVAARPAGAATFALFHMPLARSAARPAERELIERARIGRVDLEGKHAVTYEWGDGTRTVLLVHGWQSRGSRLSDLVTAFLDRGYRVVAFDAPGHGAASGRSATILDYRTVLTTLNERYGAFDGLVAHSLGALAAFFALRHGVKAERIVTISGVCDFDHLVDEFATALGLRPRLKAELHRRIASDLFPGLPADRSPFSAAHTTEEVDAPLLVIHDADDTRIGVEQGRRLAGAFGERARLVVTGGLGHRRILGAPEVVRAAVDFVEHGPGPSHPPRH